MANLYTNWDDLAKQVKLFDFEKGSLSDSDKLPWPVVALLAGRGEKCILRGDALPRLQHLEQALEDLKHRLRTAYLFRDQEEDASFNPRLHARNDTWQPPRFADLENHLENLHLFLRNNFLDFLDKPENNFKHTGNLTDLDRLGLQLLGKLNLTAVRSDKDHAFVVLKQEDKLALQRQVLSNSDEFEPFATWNGWEEEKATFFLNLCRNAASKTAKPTALFRFLSSGLTQQVRGLWTFERKSTRPSLTATLELNLKTHKSPPQPRELENHRPSFLRPAQLYVGSRLREVLWSNFPWLLQDSRHLVRLLTDGTLVVPPGFALYTADVKRFYPSCEQGELHHTFLHLTGDKEAADLADFLLKHQLLADPRSGEVFARHKGAGMGLGCSGELCDANTALRNDGAFLCRQDGLNLLWYVRYRDDGLFCGRNNLSEAYFDDLAADFSRRGSNLQLDLACSEGSTHWLDLELTAHTHLSPLVHTKTYQKPTNKGGYLSGLSYHSKATLKGWAEAELRRYARNSTDLKDALACARKLELALEMRHYNPEDLHFEGRLRALWAQRGELLAEQQGHAQSLQRQAPLVLRHHRVWEQLGFGALVRQHQHNLDLAFGGQAPKLFAAYKKAGPHLYVKVRNLEDTERRKEDYKP